MGFPKGGIGFFDSGIGGLTLLAECVKRINGETFYYLGDNCHAPYGNLPLRKIRKYTNRVFRKFARLQVKAVVIACNTVTAVCIESLRRKYSFPIIGVEPAIFPAMRKGQKVLALMTAATCKSERFQTLCYRARCKYPNAILETVACCQLAGEIEKNLQTRKIDLKKHLPDGTPNVVVYALYIYKERNFRILSL